MDKICGVVDVEGFSVRLVGENARYSKKFLIRELAFAKISSNELYEVQVFHFDLSGFKKDKLMEGDLKTIWHQERMVHGLSFHPTTEEKAKYELIPYEELNDVLLDIYRACRTDERYVVAFKGGNFEKQLLEEVEIPSLNLENYGCPSFKELYNLKTSTYSGLNCGQHKLLSKKAREKPPMHCAKAEVTAFRDWVVSYE